MEGRRPLVAEVQALVAPSSLPSPRRATSGLDTSRVAMIIAVLDKRAGAPVGSCDTFAATIGGMRITEPAADLAIALALASSILDRSLPPDVVALGEVGLAGEVRRVTGLQRRLAEAARLGFRVALVPPGTIGDVSQPDGLRIIEVADLEQAIAAISMVAARNATAPGPHNL
jgi:DNA repair protein RadA/Sms